MKSDPILEEVWRAKDALAKRFNYDIHRLAEYLRSKEPEVQSGQGSKKNVIRKRSPAKRLL